MIDAARHPTSRSAVASTLLESARESILQHGLLAVSARTIAAGARTSPSVIHYHYGNADALIVLALEEARGRDRKWRDELLTEIASLRPTRKSFVIFLQAVTTAAGYKYRDLTLLRWDVSLAAILQTRIEKVASAWRDDLVQFWKVALKQLGVETSPTLVAEFSDAVSRLYLAAGDGPTHVAWVTQTIAYFAQRLTGALRTDPTEPLWRDLHRRNRLETSSIERKQGSTAARIVEGALKIVLEHGPQAVTHRAVASAARVSLSSTTYHFASRGEILHAAFSQLRARTLARIASLSTARRKQTLTLTELIELMGAALVPDSRKVSREYVAAQSLLHAAARDLALRPHAEQLYANMGEATFSLFARTRSLRDVSDPAATFIFALWTDAMLCNAGLEGPDNVALYVRKQQRAMIALLCGK